jgi:hypothetical protein
MTPVELMPGVGVETITTNRAARGLPVRQYVGSDTAGWSKVPVAK